MGACLSYEVVIISTVSSSVASIELLLTIILCPMVRILKLTTAQQAITPVIGKAVWLLKILTVADVTAPIPI